MSNPRSHANSALNATHLVLPTRPASTASWRDSKTKPVDFVRRASAHGVGRNGVHFLVEAGETRSAFATASVRRGWAAHGGV